MEDYKVIRAVGKGSFGKVYLVRHVAEGRQYVMKVIKLKGIPTKEREACRNEVMLMQRLQHPNIVAYKDSFFANDRDNLCIVMTFCDGGDLAGRLGTAKGALFKEDQIMHWFVQMALSIHYMHENKVLHRDIKTQNIFLLGNGRLVLGDLGISKVLDGTAAFAKTQIGTPYYMSPELFKSAPYNHKSDVWALGCVLYEMCTLNHPFEAASLHALAAKIMTGKYTPINAKYSQSLRALIASMLALSPAARPSMSDILQQPYIKKHVFNFIKDIVERSAVAVGPSLPLPVGEGTMMFKAAAFKLGGSSAAGSDAMARSIAAGLGPHASNLQRQLAALGMQPLVAKALTEVEGAVGGGPLAAAPTTSSTITTSSSAGAVVSSAPSIAGGARGGAAVVASVPSTSEAHPPLSPKAAKKIVKDSQAALDREEERKRAVETALARLREEKDLRAKQREEFQRKQERMLRYRGAEPRLPGADFKSAAYPGPTSGAAAIVQQSRSPAPAVPAKPVRVPIGVGVSVTPSSGTPVSGPKAVPMKTPGVIGSRAPSIPKALPPSGQPTPVASAAAAADARALQLRERAAALRREAAAAEAARKGKPPAVVQPQQEAAPPSLLAARRAEAERKRVAELEQWERDKSNRAHAQAVSVSALRAAQPEPAAVRKDKDAAAVSGLPRSASAPRAQDMPSGLPPKAKREPSSSSISAAEAQATPDLPKGPAPFHERSTSVPALAAPQAGKAPKEAGVERSLSVGSMQAAGAHDAALQAELAPFLPRDFDYLSARDKVLVRSRALKLMEEARVKEKLEAAVVEGAVDRKRAQYLQREQYRGVNAALAGALPIHATVLETSAVEATEIVTTLRSRLPGARYESAASAHDELPSDSKHEDVVAAGSDLQLADFHAIEGAGMDEGDEGYRKGELPDSDSEDSIILEAATEHADDPRRPAGKVSDHRRIAIDSGEDDENEIKAEEARLHAELVRSTMRCTDLRVSLEVARKLALDAGVPVAKHVRPISALPLGGVSISVPIVGVDASLPNALAVPDAMRKSSDDRPIRPSGNPAVFGAVGGRSVPVDTGSQEPIATKAPLHFAVPSPMYTTVDEGDEDEDDIGDDDGNEEGGISFKSLPLGGDELEGGSEWHRDEYTELGVSGVTSTDGVAAPFAPPGISLDAYEGGGLSKKIEVYRKSCQQAIGSELFELIYTKLKDGMEEDTLDAHDLAELAAKLPADKRDYLDHIEALLSMEDQLL